MFVPDTVGVRVHNIVAYQLQRAWGGEGEKTAVL